MSNVSEAKIHEMALAYVNGGLTLRKLEEIFKVSKSAIHKNFRKKLQTIDSELYLKVIDLLEYNKVIGHIRGGYATKSKYQK